MVIKRPFHGDDETEAGAPAQESKRLKNAIRDVLGMLTMKDMVAQIEPFVRIVVRDEVERTVSRVLQSSISPSFNQAETSGGRGFLLRFVNQPTATTFTGSRIEAEDGSHIWIELCDANSKARVSSGPLSYMKIELLVLDGDFGSDDQEDWSEKEFNANVIREREGRRPLVTGDLNVTLRNGIGQISEVVLTDNSSWQRSRKFRLGARALPKTCGEARIREARSEAFVVKDHRGELYKKHYPPRFNDEVWRLEKIAKDGASHKKLAEMRIETVGRFLQYYAAKPSELRRGLGNGISNKIWDTIIEHANTCVPDDDKLYTYYSAGQSVGLLFNSVYKLIGITFDGQSFEPLDNLAPPQKDAVESLKREAYKNVENWNLTDAGAISGSSGRLTCLQTHNPSIGLQQIEFPVAQQEQGMLMDFSPAESGVQSEISLAQNTHQLQVFSPMRRNSFKLSDFFSLPYPGENNWSTSIPQPNPEDFWPAQTSAWPPANSLIFSSGSEGELGFISSHPSFGVHMSRIGKSKAGWCKLRAAIKLRSAIAAKRMWQSNKFLYVGF